MSCRAVIVSDGKRGHENQSRVIARALGDTDPLLMLLRPHVREGGFTEVMLRLRLRSKGKYSIGTAEAQRLVQRHLAPDDNAAFRAFAHTVKDSGGNLRLVVISSGTPPATFNLVMARMLGAECVVNMTPSLLPRRLFDLCIVPVHDLGAGQAEANVVASRLALGHHDEAPARNLAGQICREAGLDPDGRYFGVALGGPSKTCPWAGDCVLDELAALHGLARGEQARLLVTTSRRTPEWCLAWLDKHYRPSELVPYFLDASKDPLNPLPAFYELSQRMFITGDSFSMVSEAIHAGHRPLLLKVSHGPARKKLGRALAGLEAEGLVVMGGGEEDLPHRVAEMKTGRDQPNTHYDALAEQIRARLKLG